jgi:hypothetical protein
MPSGHEPPPIVAPLLAIRGSNNTHQDFPKSDTAEVSEPTYLQGPWSWLHGHDRRETPLADERYAPRLRPASKIPNVEERAAMRGNDRHGAGTAELGVMRALGGRGSRRRKSKGLLA